MKAKMKKLLKSSLALFLTALLFQNIILENIFMVNAGTDKAKQEQERIELPEEAAEDKDEDPTGEPGHITAPSVIPMETATGGGIKFDRLDVYNTKAAADAIKSVAIEVSAAPGSTQIAPDSTVRISYSFEFEENIDALEAGYEIALPVQLPLADTDTAYYPNTADESNYVLKFESIGGTNRFRMTYNKANAGSSKLTKATAVQVATFKPKYPYNSEEDVEFTAPDGTITKTIQFKKTNVPFELKKTVTKEGAYYHWVTEIQPGNQDANQGALILEDVLTEYALHKDADKTVKFNGTALADSAYTYENTAAGDAGTAEVNKITYAIENFFQNTSVYIPNQKYKFEFYTIVAPDAYRRIKSDGIGTKSVATAFYNKDFSSGGAAGTNVKIKDASNNTKLVPELVSYHSELMTGGKRLKWTVNLNKEMIQMYNAVLQIDINGTDYHTADVESSTITLDGSEVAFMHYYTEAQLLIGTGSAGSGKWNIDRTTAEVIFYTDITDKFFTENIDSHTFDIKVNLKWNYAAGDSGEVGLDGKWDGADKQPVYKNNILKKIGNYKASDGSIIWNITVNEAENELTNITVTDTIGADQELVGVYTDAAATTEMAAGSNSSGGACYSKTGITAGSEVTLYIPDGIKNTTYYLKTKVVGDAALKDYVYVNAAANTAHKFGNTAKITAKFGGADVDQTVKPTAAAVSNLIEKTGKYLADTYSFEWEITVNKNKMQLTDAFLEDIIPEGTEYDSETGVSSTGGITPAVTVNADGSLKIGLGNISDIVVLTYRTKITDFSKFNENKTQSVTNAVYLKSTEIKSAGIRVEKKVEFTVNVIKKESVVRKKSYHTWKIVVNEDYITSRNAVLTDTFSAKFTEGPNRDEAIPILLDASMMSLTANMKGSADSVPITIVKDGSQTEDQAGYSFDSNTGTFTIRFPVKEIYHTAKFTLTYTTKPNVTPGKSYSVTNNATFYSERNDSMSTQSSGKTWAVSVISGDAEEEAPGTKELTVINQENSGTKKIEGTRIELWNEFDEKAAEGTTDVNGKTVFKNLAPEASYKIKQIKPADQYLIADAEKTVDMSKRAEKSEETLLSKKVSEDISFLKKGEVFNSDQYEPLADAEFGLYGVTITDAEEIIGSTADKTAGSASDGTVEFTGLQCGEYAIKEIKAPDAYMLNKDTIRISVQRNDDYTDTIVTIKGLEKEGSDYLFKNKLKKVGITVVLKNNKDEELEIPSGLTFRLVEHGKPGTVVKTVTTKDEGLVFENIPAGTYDILDVDKINIRGYKLSEDAVNNQYKNISHKADVATAITIFYEPDLCDITVKLVDKEDESRLLEGGKFLLTDDTQKKYEGTTDGTGTVVFEDCIRNVDYKLKEVTPPEKYLIDTKEYTFKPSTEDYIFTPAIKNERVKAIIEFTKSGEDFVTGISEYKALAGAKFRLYRSNESYTLYDEIANAAALSGMDGTVKFAAQEAGYYIVKEETAPKQYKISDKEIKLCISANADYTESIISFESGETKEEIKNELLREKLILTLLDESGGKVDIPKEAAFELISGDGEKVIETVYSDGKRIVFPNVPYGKYKVKRVSDIQIPGYVILHGDNKKPAKEDIFEVVHRSVTTDNLKLQEQELELLCKTADCTIIVKIVNNSKPVAGVKVVLLDADGNVYREGVTDEKGVVTWDNLPEGSYSIRQLNAQNQINKNAPGANVTVKSGETVNKTLKTKKSAQDSSSGSSEEEEEKVTPSGQPGGTNGTGADVQPAAANLVKLPQSGSFFDFTVIAGIGALFIMAGILYEIFRKRKPR